MGMGTIAFSRLLRETVGSRGTKTMEQAPSTALQTITTSAYAARSVYAADLDGDGDLDVLSASFNDDRIAWYENDGSGTFVSMQTITTSADGAQDVYAADLDGDGDYDILSASYNDDQIAWYENNGTGTFGSMQFITTLADGANGVYVADLDGDGDCGVLSASSNDDRIAWYENNGTGNFGNIQTLTTSKMVMFGSTNSVYAADLVGKTLSFSLSGGSDSDLFMINPATNQLQFKEVPDFEQPMDSNGDNVYEVVVSVMDEEGLSDSQNLKIILENVNESPFFHFSQWKLLGDSFRSRELYCVPHVSRICGHGCEFFSDLLSSWSRLVAV